MRQPFIIEDADTRKPTRFDFDVEGVFGVPSVNGIIIKVKNVMAENGKAAPHGIIKITTGNDPVLLNREFEIQQRAAKAGVSPHLAGFSSYGRRQLYEFFQQAAQLMKDGNFNNLDGGKMRKGVMVAASIEELLLFVIGSKKTQLNEKLTGLFQRGEYVSVAIMDFVHARPLGSVLDQFESNPKALDQIWRVTCTAIANMHKNHIVHGDLHVNNILISTDNGISASIIDFGMAHVIDKPKTLTMHPEQEAIKSYLIVGPGKKKGQVDCDDASYLCEALPQVSWVANQCISGLNIAKNLDTISEAVRSSKEWQVASKAQKSPAKPPAVADDAYACVAPYRKLDGDIKKRTNSCQKNGRPKAAYAHVTSKQRQTCIEGCYVDN